MSILAQSEKALSEVLVYEAGCGYSRSALNLKTQVLGSVVNASGTLIKPEGSDEEKAPIGVVVGTNQIVDTHALVLKRGLVFPKNATPEHIQTALAALKMLGIKAH